MSDAKIILYIGSDDHYFHQLSKAISKVDPYQDYTLQKEYDSKNLMSCVLSFVKINPVLVFVDFSKNFELTIELAKNLVRLSSQKKNKGLIGLLDSGSAMSLIKEANISGVLFNHIKSSEMEDLIYQAFLLIDPRKARSPEVARARSIELELEMLHPMKIGYISEKYIHAEHNISFGLNQEIQIKLHFNPEFPVKTFKLVRNLDANYYYPLEHVSDFEYVYDENLVSFQESQIRSLFSVSVQKKPAKRTRLTIVDPGLKILQQIVSPLDQYPFAIRFYHSFDPKMEIVQRNMAGVICVNCPPQDPVVAKKNLVPLFEKIKSIEKYKPFLILFNSSWDSPSARAEFGFEQILCEKGDFDFEKVIRLVQFYETKGGRILSHDPAKSFFSRESRRYFRKDDPESYADFQLPVILKDLSESELYFKTKLEIPPFTQFVIESLFNIFVTTLDKRPSKERDGNLVYQAVIHSFGETQKQKLRAFIISTIVNQNKEE